MHTLYLSRKVIDCIVIIWVGSKPSHKLYNLLPHLARLNFSHLFIPWIAKIYIPNLGKYSNKPVTVHIFAWAHHGCLGFDIAVGLSVSLGKTVDCIVISEGGLKPHNYSIYYLSLKDRNCTSLVWSCTLEEKIKRVNNLMTYIISHCIT